MTGRSRRARGLLLGTLLAAAVGCAPPARPLTPCDVRQSDCQQTAAAKVDELRGRLWDPGTRAPEVKVITPLELLQIAEALARQLNRAAASATWTPPLQSAGLVDPAVDVVTADQLLFADSLAVYWPAARRVTIVDRGDALDDVDATVTLVHELVHAAQDRELDLLRSPALTTDQELVRTALVEGEAVLHHTRAELSLRGTDAKTFDWSASFQAWFAGERALTTLVASPHAEIRLRWPYSVGGHWVAQAWLREGVTGVNRTFLDPPRDFLTMLLALDGRPQDDRRPVLCASGRAIPGATLVAADTLGAALLYAHLVRTLSPVDDDQAWQAALTWRGDRMWLLRDAQQTPIMFWRVHAPGMRATSIGATLAARTDPPLLDGDDLLLWSGGTPALIAGARQNLTCRTR
jgi:hypothetical protein